MTDNVLLASRMIAMVVTPEGLPLAYEMMPGNTADKTTLPAMIALLKKRHGQLGRIWVMDRGIPTEESLARMRACDPPMHYLVGTPKARLHRAGSGARRTPLGGSARTTAGQMRARGWRGLRPHRKPRAVDKERAMRRRSLKKYWKRLGELSQLKKPTRDELLLKLGQARG